MAKLEEVLQSQTFLGLNATDKKTFVDNYFNKRLATSRSFQSLGEEDRATFRQNFDTKVSALTAGATTTFGRAVAQEGSRLKAGYVQEFGSTGVPQLDEALKRVSPEAGHGFRDPLISEATKSAGYSALQQLRVARGQKIMAEAQQKYPIDPTKTSAQVGQFVGQLGVNAAVVGLAAITKNPAVLSFASNAQLAHFYITKTADRERAFVEDFQRKGEKFDSAEVRAYAEASGLIEGLFEKIGTEKIVDIGAARLRPILTKMGKALKAGDTKVARSAMKEILRPALLEEGMTEGVEEWLTQVTDNVIDIYGVKVDQEKGLFEDAGQAFGLGAAGGVGLGVWGNVLGRYVRSPIVRGRLKKDFAELPQDRIVENFARGRYAPLTYQDALDVMEQEMKKVAPAQEPEPAVQPASVLLSGTPAVVKQPVLSPEQLERYKKAPVTQAQTRKAEDLEEAPVSETASPEAIQPLVSVKEVKPKPPTVASVKQEELAARKAQNDALALQWGRQQVAEGKPVTKAGIFAHLYPDAGRTKTSPRASRLFEQLEAEGLNLKGTKAEATAPKAKSVSTDKERSQTPSVASDKARAKKARKTFNANTSDVVTIPAEVDVQTILGQLNAAVVDQVISADVAERYKGRLSKVSTNLAKDAIYRELLGEVGLTGKEAPAPKEKAVKTKKTVDPLATPVAPVTPVEPVVEDELTLQEREEQERAIVAEQEPTAEDVAVAEEEVLAVEKPSNVVYQITNSEIEEKIRKTLGYYIRGIKTEFAGVSDPMTGKPISPDVMKDKMVKSLTDKMLQAGASAKLVEEILANPEGFHVARGAIRRGQAQTFTQDRGTTLLGGLVSIDPQILSEIIQDARRVISTLKSTSYPEISWQVFRAGKAIYQSGVTRFKAWSARMQEAFGEKVRPLLRTMFNYIKKISPDDGFIVLPGTEKILATHMTNAKFGTKDKPFDPENFGLTGEGAMAYGWGVYLTDFEAEETSRNYWKSLRVRTDALGSWNQIVSNFTSLSNPDKIQFLLDLQRIGRSRGLSWGESLALDSLDGERLASLFTYHHRVSAESLLTELENLYHKWFPTFIPRSYRLTTTIPKDGWLRWDQNPTKEQKGLLIELIADSEKLLEFKKDYDPSRYEGWTVEQLYDRLAIRIGNERSRRLQIPEDRIEAQKLASKRLHQYGFVGIKVPANFTSRNRSEDTFNYIVFDPKDIEVVRRENLTKEFESPRLKAALRAVKFSVRRVIKEDAGFLDLGASTKKARGLSDEELEAIQTGNATTVEDNSPQEDFAKASKSVDDTEQLSETERTREEKILFLSTIDSPLLDIFAKEHDAEDWQDWLKTRDLTKRLSIPAKMRMEFIWMLQMEPETTPSELAQFLSAVQKKMLASTREGSLLELQMIQQPRKSGERDFSDVAYSRVDLQNMREIWLPRLGMSEEAQSERALLATRQKISEKQISDSKKEKQLAGLLTKPPKLTLDMLTANELALLTRYLRDIRRSDVLSIFARQQGLNEEYVTPAVESVHSVGTDLPPEGKDLTTEEIRSVWIDLLGSDHIWEDILGYQSELAKKISVYYRRAQSFSKKIRVEADKALEQTLPANQSTLTNVRRNRQEYKLLSGGTIKLSPTTFAHIILTAKDPRGGERLRRFGLWGKIENKERLSADGDKPWIPADKKDENGFLLESSLDNLISQATPEVLQLADAIHQSMLVLRKYLLDWVETLPSEVEKIQFRHALDKNGEDYYPEIVSGHLAELDKAEAAVGRSRLMRPNASKISFFMERLSSVSADGIDIEDSFEILGRLKLAVSTLVALQEPTETIGNILYDKKFSETLASTGSGAKRLWGLRSWISDSFGYYTRDEIDSISSALNRRLGTSAIGLLAFRISSVISQYLGVVSSTLGPSGVPPRYFAKTAGIDFTALHDRLMKLSGLYQYRISTSMLERMSPTHIVALGTKLVRDEETVLDKFKKTGMTAITAADSRAILRVFAMVEAWGKDQGWNEQRVVDEFEYIVDNTQATPDLSALPKLMREAKKGNFALRSIFFLSTDITKVWTKTAWDLKVFRSLDDPDKNAMRWLLWEVFALALIYPLWKLLATTVQKAVVKAPGALLTDRSLEDYWSEITPFDPSRIGTTLIQSYSTMLFGPFGELPTSFALRIKAHAEGKRADYTTTTPLGQMGETMAEVIGDVFSLTKLALDGSRGTEEDQINKALTIMANLARVGGLFAGSPVVLGDFIAGFKGKDRKYYYDMYFRSIYHSNGVPLPEPKARLRKYTLGKLRTLGVDSDALRQAIRQRVARARG